MKTRGFLTILATTVLALASSGMAQEMCSAETIKGTYEITCTGWAKLGPPFLPAPTLLPAAMQGIFTNKIEEGRIVSTGKANLSLGGKQVVGTYSSDPSDVNPDCTANIKFQVTYDLPKSEQITVFAVALDQGKEIRGFNVFEGHAVTCSLRLMSRNTNQQN